MAVLGILTVVCIVPAGFGIAQKGPSHAVKPTAPVRIRVSAATAPVPGSVLPVQVRVAVSAELSGVRVSIGGSDGLQVIGGETHFDVGDMPSGGTWERTIDMLPLPAGRPSVSIFVVAEAAGFGPIARSVVAPVGMPVPQSAERTAGPASTEERLKRIPAVETLR